MPAGTPKTATIHVHRPSIRLASQAGTPPARDRGKHKTHKERGPQSAGLVQPKGAVEGSFLAIAAPLLFGFVSLDTVWLNLLNSACSVEENVILPTACARVEAINECICRSWVKRKIIGAPAGVLWIAEQPDHLLT